MTPNWPELWKREPGLRPSGLDGPDPRDGSWEQSWIDQNGRIDLGVSDRIGACVGTALCRDAAVRWLLEQRRLVFLKLSKGGCYSVGKVHYAESETGPILQPMNEMGSDLDTALFAACTAVLDAREKPE